MQDFAGRVTVITGAASGFGREFARTAAGLGMRLVLADVQPDPLAAVVAELSTQGASVIGLPVDVSRADEVDALADKAFAHFGSVDLLFNNAGVAAGGLLWEHEASDWSWVLGVNLFGVIHGVRAFVPRMLAQQREGHIVNTASVAGLVTPQAMGVYNVGKHGVVALSETLYQDLRLVDAKIGVTVLCPAFVPTGIADSARNRPATVQGPLQATGNGDPAAPSLTPSPTPSQRAAQASLDKAVSSGKLSAAEVATMTFDAIRNQQFYLLTHPKILDTVRLRMEDVLAQRNPSDPFSYRKDLRVKV